MESAHLTNDLTYCKYFRVLHQKVDIIVRNLIFLALIFQIFLTTIVSASEHTLKIINFTESTIQSISIAGAEILFFEKIKRKSEGEVKFTIPASKCIARVRMRFSPGKQAITLRNVCDGGTMTVLTTE